MGKSIITRIVDHESDFGNEISTAIEFNHNRRSCAWFQEFAKGQFSISRPLRVFHSWLAYEVAQRRIGALSMSYVDLSPHTINPILSREDYIMLGRRIGKSYQVNLTREEYKEWSVW